MPAIARWTINPRSAEQCSLLSREGDDLKTALYTCARCAHVSQGFKSWRNHMKKSMKFIKNSAKKEAVRQTTVPISLPGVQVKAKAERASAASADLRQEAKRERGQALKTPSHVQQATYKRSVLHEGKVSSQQLSLNLTDSAEDASHGIEHHVRKRVR
eukprot:CAMPEP_0119315110 /NCGR_PEP_ID=MMETSP1333-20130426/34496_1 /TAXON_ID=418940 /ORGANISM="Scyphosphaera apsteinii, Strain RCC1455" /LENGTH=157 /DNA_ID=CAMNT_0007320353 /DNA_START=15 /DNA_END=485 /DNA_ORIENTATION=+